MKRLVVACAAITALLGPCVASAASSLTYPAAPKGDVTDTYFGTVVPDPYRWLETYSPQTLAWIKDEGTLTRAYLDAIPQRAAIAAHLRKLANYEKISAPSHVGNQYFYYYNSGLQNQAVLDTMTGPHGKAHILLDPNTLSTDGTVALGSTATTNDAKYMAYSTQASGSDWQTWRVRNIATGKDLADTLVWSKFSGASWLNDDSGFYYDRYPAPKAGETFKGALSGQTVYFHKLGTPQSSDTLFYKGAHPDDYVGAGVTLDGRYIIINVSGGATINNDVYYVDRNEKGGSVHALFAKRDAQYGYVDNVGTRFIFTTTRNAPNTKVVAVDLRSPAVMTTVVPQAKQALQGVSTAGHRLFTKYLTDAHSAVKIYDYNGRFIRDVALPGLGTAGGFDGWPNDRAVYYSYSGYTSPSVTYAYDIASGNSTVYRKPKLAFDATLYTTKEIFYTSKDGTRVPMMISYKKDLKLDGTNPTILYGYGGFDIAMTPHFSTTIATWLGMGGVYAVANIRGGSEYGEAWHRGGMLANKQNVFDDFIAAAEYLIAKKYTTTPKLAINGGSNGGLLMGAVENQRPDLFGAVVAQVGVMDMLRFDKFTVGHGWISDYGCSTCSAAQFKTLYAYSPLHNVRAVAYPPTLVMTADHDDRVFPAHSFKYTAAMQAAQTGDAPILLRVETKSGHGGGAPISMTINEWADVYGFLVKNLNVTVPKNF
ncbi:MAG: prolyl oligopeptidase family serine peptidase [Candidatus Eremiobacteraeota bacterium]|nr:prolyl oligopeptidase family serine peptidase [Candidatus Eremiobacteraeota bacterium]